MKGRAKVPAEEPAEDSEKNLGKNPRKKPKNNSGKRGGELRAALFERRALSELRELCSRKGEVEPVEPGGPERHSRKQDCPTKERTEASSARVLLAVSGGVDSMVMAHIAAKLFAADLKETAIAHVNFHLRGKASDLDEAFVREWGAGHGIKIFTADFDTRGIAEKEGISIEMAARNLRYEWFRDIAVKEKYDFIAIAHNANDNAETLILNLVRGTGYAGLKGIMPLRAERVRGRDIRIIRPLLWAQRSEIVDYANSVGLGWRTDATNGESEFARNKIRNKVFPLLSEINPSAVETLNRNIGRFAAANEILTEYVAEKEAALDLCRKEGDAAENALPGRDILSLRKRYLVSAFSIAGLCGDGSGNTTCSITGNRAGNKFGHPAGRSDGYAAGNRTAFPRITFLIDSILAKYGFNSSVTANIASSAVSPGSETKVFVSPSHTAVIERGFLKIYNAVPKPSPEEITVGGAGEYRFGSLTIILTVLKEGEKAGQDGAVSLLDADKVRFPLVCRTMRNGDRFRPFGMKGRKSVADFLNGRKTDMIFRNIVPVLQEMETDEGTGKTGRIIALPGIEICDDLRITGSTRRTLAVTVR